MSNPSVTRVVEDYVTHIWKAQEWPGGTATTTDLADRLGVRPSTVSSTLKKLARDGFITYEPYGEIALTPAGRELAVGITRRHRLLETYLTQFLGLPWDMVHDEADRLEHAVSDLVLDRMDAALGHPTHDPHGDPIPARDGTITPQIDHALEETAAGSLVQVTRVSDRSADLLRYLEEMSVTVGAVLRLDEVSEAADAVRITVGDRPLQLSRRGAAAIRVTAVQDPASAVGA